MSDETNARACKKADCQAATTGSCAEGHTPIASCPNYGVQPDAPSNAYDGELDESIVEEHPRADERVRLDSGEALTPEDVEVFLRWRPASFITVIGESHSGKTTLICALYDRFLRGFFGGMAFAGSRTLVALEKRSHHSRVDSGRVTPETARTSHQEGLRYFHFALAEVGHAAKRVDLLLSDRSGEVYRGARDNSTIVDSLPEIRQADRIVLLLDGRRVANPIERAGAVQAVRQTLRVFVDNGALGANSVVHVVTTKIDIIEGSADKVEIDTALQLFRERLRIDFEPKLKSLSFHEVAARDPTGTLEPAHGLDALLRCLVAPSTPNTAVQSSPLKLRTEFDRLLARTPMELLP